MSLIVEARHQLGQFSLDASFTSEGGVTALFGRSGSGKTSLLRIIAGLTAPQQGQVTLDDDVLVDTDARRFVPCHRRRFGYVFQEARLFPHLTVRKNLGYGRWFAPKSTCGEDFARIVDLLGIEALLERRPSNLSGGEKQRVAIGRALLSTPRLLLMDEPLAALDEERKAEILPYLERLRDETSVPIVYVSHSVAEVARLADHVVVMEAGKVRAFGTAADILGDNTVSIAAERRETGALLEGTVRAVDDVHGLTTVALKNAMILIPGRHEIGRRVRLHIPARDVMLATTKPQGISALNVLDGEIVGLTYGSSDTMDISIDCGGDLIQSRITRFSTERLELAIGKPVYAIVKTVAFERP
ncbi:molybdate transport system ATP-binding protein [Pararhizobium capsulatum DSM 1112]|uniref:Molybdate transport system ATP-binding protein n=1 Tax=Pararhizobium capsulatum DSM 1112 TaxID=1121113 RepID=A0ABU0BUZ0_9HYPH|nr:molybdenum ABC transporter ATP-binding protein [Pararhizobium capsulatum]MDQ0321501.1 molybdate transport system ATP-binding protein [Pararhizobium capsulatum DSM 1112]